MAIREIVTYPSPVLKQVAEVIDHITSETRELIDDMFETMYASDGVGLAAPQVGVGLRIIVVDVNVHGVQSETTQGPIGPKSHGRQKYAMVNPVIISREGEIEWEEGCLSIPDFRVVMKRSNKIKTDYLDAEGHKRSLDAEGLLAVAIQHEIDHLDGKLLIDNVSRLKRDLYVKKLKKSKLD
jgi:peptide deformylase